MNSSPLTRRAIHEELERVRADFHTLVTAASPADLRRPSAGTRWTNGQLLFCSSATWSSCACCPWCA